MHSDPLFSPSLAPYVSVILTMLTTASVSVTIEPVIWAGLGEGSLISEDLFWDGLLSHTLGKLVLSAS